jgi:hypothetical protein
MSWWICNTGRLKKVVKKPKETDLSLFVVTGFVQAPGFE